VHGQPCLALGEDFREDRTDRIGEPMGDDPVAEGFGRWRVR
jgi:hypothetical protein